MKTFILYSGHLGSTAYAAKLLANELGEKTEVFDLTKNPDIDFSQAEKVVFGTNVRMFRLHGLFKKYVKKFLKAKTAIPAYVYIVCADADKSRNYMNKAEKLLCGRCAYSVYAGGLLDSDGATGFVKKIIESVKKNYINEGKTPPSINEDVIAAFALRIKE